MFHLFKTDSSATFSDLALVNQQFVQVFANLIGRSQLSRDVSIIPSNDTTGVHAEWNKLLQRLSSTDGPDPWRTMTLMRMPHTTWPLHILSYTSTISPEPGQEITRLFESFLSAVERTNQSLQNTHQFCNVHIVSQHQIQRMIDVLNSMLPDLELKLTDLWHRKIMTGDAPTGIIQSIVTAFKVTVHLLGQVPQLCPQFHLNAYDACQRVAVALPDLSPVTIFTDVSDRLASLIQSSSIGGVCRTGNIETYSQKLVETTGVAMPIETLATQAVSWTISAQTLLLWAGSSIPVDVRASAPNEQTLFVYMRNVQEWTRNIILSLLFEPALHPPTDCEVAIVPKWLASSCDSAMYIHPQLQLSDFDLVSIDSGVPVVASVTGKGTVFISEKYPKLAGCEDVFDVILHEICPGHHMQFFNASTSVSSHIPLYKQFGLGHEASIAEGWALYAESLWIGVIVLCATGVLCDDTAIPASPIDPPVDGDVLQQRARRLLWAVARSQLLRACRPLVDIGIHCVGMSRSNAISMMAKLTPHDRSDLETQHDRYISYPAQAAAYKIGEMYIRWCLHQWQSAHRRYMNDSMFMRSIIQRFHTIVLRPSIPTMSELAERLRAEIHASVPDAKIEALLMEARDSADSRCKFIQTATEMQKLYQENCLTSVMLMSNQNIKFPTLHLACLDPLAASVIYGIW